MTVSTGFPIKVAIVRTLRFGHGAKSLLKENGSPELSGDWLHEGFAAAKVDYPFVTYQQIYGPRIYLWGSVLLRAGFDVKVFARNSVVANNLDALNAAVLDEALLQVAGQSTLICRRIADLSGSDVDEEGKKIYMVGGTYEVWTDQPLPRQMNASFSAGAVIV